MADADKRNERGAENGDGMLVRVICPDKTLFDGEAESVIIKTRDGYEGFLKGRAACVRLLPEEGEIKLRDSGETEFKTIKAKGGFAHMDRTLNIYADEARWEKAEE